MKIAAWDIETTNLSALMGRVLCSSVYPIYNADPNELRIAPRVQTLRGDKIRDEDPISDRSLLVAIRDHLEQFNMIVTWNGKQFDLPFLNARLLKFGERKYTPQLHLDLMYYAGGVSARIGSRKLVNVQKYFGVAHSKTELEWETWQRAATGDKKAMNEVIEHCEADVRVLADVYQILIPLVANIHR